MALSFIGVRLTALQMKEIDALIKTGKSEQSYVVRYLIDQGLRSIDREAFKAESKIYQEGKRSYVRTGAAGK